ncbi:hypothetical protein F993_01850 [Acinetobacter proteolyticus]|jgi:hypothetical protein|uniref:DUF3465 domain-containing protein n=1 Tax=Acinetobacter proteolyticus TaxID=1776741 RepID=A0A653K228_9GAMM|nr:DUF3465 domain-containing protein [Acinetobacter proteolyticus]ENU23696.1 hypothetical protein F993_01850 [Acinetobacter proteolyticus]VXA54797.1 conserved hypothetical protein [Acinetobacter proteolyticus]
MKTQKNNLILVAIVVLVAAYFGLDFKQKQNTSHSSIPDTSNAVAVDDQNKIMQAYQQQRSNVQVQAQGVVKAILPDDNEGSRHQKMILKLENGLTVLIAHNIDLAPRIEGLKKGDTVEFFGEYEYSQKGGVIHWTHHDPRGKHVDGWLKYQGKMYQ